MRKFVCSVCGYIYDEAKGIPEAGIAPGTVWEALPANWVCPLCGAAKADFTEQGAQTDAKDVRPAAEAPADMKELSALEVSIICSNLARGCEKQYRPEEAGLFRQLADYYKSVSAPAAEPSFDGLLELVGQDLDANLPAARAAAAGEADRGALRAITWSEKVTRILKSLLARSDKPGGALPDGTGVYVCTICGFIYIGEKPPELCPVCKVPSWKFEKIEGRAM